MNLLRTDFGVSIAIPGAEPLPIRHIMGIGMNYAEHAKEQGKGIGFVSALAWPGALRLLDRKLPGYDT